jgi:hypothetical protein
MNLNLKNAFNFEVSKLSSGKGIVTITAKVNGSGSHQLTVRSNNLTIKVPTKKIVLKSGEKTTLKWECKISLTDEPWVAVIVPDNNLSNKKELTGSAWKK